MGKYTPSDERSGGGNDFKVSVLDGGPVKLRVLSEPLTGWECWTQDNKPVRCDSLAELASKRPAGGWRTEKGVENKPKFFVAWFVWNHAEKQVQVASFAQKTIRQQLEALEENEDWGELSKYDITLSRVKEGDKVTYTVQPSPAKPLPKDAQEAWKKVEAEAVGLSALLNDSNPFAPFSDAVPF